MSRTMKYIIISSVDDTDRQKILHFRPISGDQHALKDKTLKDLPFTACEKILWKDRLRQMPFTKRLQG